MADDNRERMVHSPSTDVEDDAADARFDMTDEEQTGVPVLPLAAAAGYGTAVGTGIAMGVAGPAPVAAGGAAILGGAIAGTAITAGAGVLSPLTGGTTGGGHNLATRVEDALAEDGRLNPAVLSNIEVNVEGDGVVTLMGAAPTGGEASLAGAIAGGVTGVARVRNELRIDMTA